MAQAPGPGVGASNVQPTGDDDSSITADPIDNFTKSRARNWTPVSQSGSGTEGNNSSGVVSSKAGLSTGAKAGIGVGVTFVGFALIWTLFSLVFRSSRLIRQGHHNLSRLTEPLPVQQYDHSTVYKHLALQKKDADHVPHELSAESQRQPIFELGNRDARPSHAR